jgi:adenylosuccinate synthase
VQKKPGKATVLIGLQYGDEGKARVMDPFLDDYDIVARFNGGPNAGHTLNVGNVKIALHQIPSGIFYDKMKLYIGSGCVLNPMKLLGEIQDINSKGISVDDRLFISGYITLIQPHHIIFDELYGREIGSTSNGIGPAYADRYLRAKKNEIKNIRLGDYLSSPDKFKAQVFENLEKIIKKHDLRNPCSAHFPLSTNQSINQLTNAEEAIDKFHKSTMMIEKYLCENPMMMQELVESGKNVFFEGAQSIMLDCVTGMTPYVTSSSTLAAAAYVGGDLPVKYHHKTIGVAKAITSRVGHGPFVSEFESERSEHYWAEGGGFAHTYEKELAQWNPEELLRSYDPFHIGIALRMLTGEYGATTTKPRRIGMLDLVMLRQNCKLNGVDELYINKFDCLTLYERTQLPGIPLVTAYMLDGKQIDYMPSYIEEMKRVKPVVEYVPFIKDDISGIRKYEELPSEAKKLVRFIESQVGTKIGGIGVGPEREQLIKIS